MPALFSSEQFPHSQTAAENITRKAREKRAESGPISETWEIEDHLTALNARLSPLRAIGTELLDAGIRTYRVLWPESEPPQTVAELSKCLLAAETRLREWRSSSARAGADEALTFVLPWYEGINLDTLETLRSDSKWMSDPELVQRCKETAYSMAQYANTRDIINGPAYSDAEDDDIEEEGDEAEEIVDEEIEAEAPDTANGTAERIAADISFEAAVDITTDGAADTVVDPATEIAPETRASSTDPRSSAAV